MNGDRPIPGTAITDRAAREEYGRLRAPIAARDGALRAARRDRPILAGDIP